MQVKSFIATVSLSAVAGAAAILMIPRNSKAYRIAEDTAQTLKSEASHMMNVISGK